MPKKSNPETNGKKIVTLVVENDKLRIDKFLSIYFSEKKIQISRTAVQDLVSEGKVLINGKQVSKSSQLVKRGDEVSCPNTPSIKLIELKPENIPLNIIFEDDDLIVLYKPFNLVVHPATGHPSGTLVNALLYYQNGDLPDTGKYLRPGIVHRLDKDTTGLMIVAKSERVLPKIQKMIKDREVSRIYLTLAHGVVKNDEARIETPFGKSIKDRKKFSVNTRNAKLAVSEYSIIQRFRDFTYLKFKLITGRTHQIRVHMSYLGHSILGDLVYGKDRRRVTIYDKTFRLKCHFLHSAYLGFKHPITEKYLNFEAPLPEQFNEVLSFLQEKEYGRKTI